MKEIILAKYGEIILKGGNRPKFENILMNNIRNSLKNVAEVKARLAQVPKKRISLTMKEV